MNLREDFPAVRLEGSPEVVQVYTGKLRHHLVGNAAWQLPHEPVVRPFHAPPADDVVALFHFFQEPRNFIRVVLQIPVHGDDDFAASKIESGF